jgi:hypothetical protein
MQMLESSLAFLMFVLFTSYYLAVPYHRLDTSLYMYELSIDAKNAIQLKGGFGNQTMGNDVVDEIESITGMCVEMDQTPITSHIVARGVATGVGVPELKDLQAAYNGTQSIKDFNLTKFTPDRVYFGMCNNSAP